MKIKIFFVCLLFSIQTTFTAAAAAQGASAQFDTAEATIPPAKVAKLDTHMGKTSKYVQCPLCETICYQNNGLYTHLANKHSSEDLNSFYICHEHKYATSNHSSFNVHRHRKHVDTRLKKSDPYKHKPLEDSELPTFNTGDIPDNIFLDIAAEDLQLPEINPDNINTPSIDHLAHISLYIPPPKETDIDNQRKLEADPAFMDLIDKLQEEAFLKKKGRKKQWICEKCNKDFIKFESAAAHYTLDHTDKRFSLQQQWPPQKPSLNW
jgi:hypothetical protein